MSDLEYTGKNVEEAKKNALAELGMSNDQVEFTVISRGRSGILGIGAGEAKVCAIIKNGESNGNTSDAQEAKAVIETLVNYLGLDAKVILNSVGGEDAPAMLNLEGEDLGVLIGRRGQTLASLQYIVRLIMSERLKRWVSINIDVAGYKTKRYESLTKLAMRLADHVKTTKRNMNLEPMPPDERRIIHLALVNNPDVTTHSTDEGDRRKVVIQYRKR
ncbi:MAG TPA: RNA-binding cell elongation regulator Jag/EloR [Dehalococcoidia bacterium]|nr:RNA-binding cell elongation regulator Jag/EloR [Dehalococcoidia bacterium]